MGNVIISAFADEYADSFVEQLQGLSEFGIRNVELRHLDRKNISVLTEHEVKEAKRMLDDSGIRVSAMGSPSGRSRWTGICRNIWKRRDAYLSQPICWARSSSVCSAFTPRRERTLQT